MDYGRVIVYACGLLAMQAAAATESGAVARDGFELHYQTEGSGRPLIVLSGGPGFNVEYMKPAAALFPAGYQFVFLEQRGTGRSRPAKLTADNMTVELMVEDLEALRTHLKQERLLLAGHSWGGMLAMAYAAAHPDKVDRLILLSSGGPTREFFTWFGDNIQARLRPEEIKERARWEDAAKKGGDPDKTMLGVVKAMTPAYFFDRANGLAFAAATREGTLHADVSMLLGADIRKHYDLRAGLKQVTRPVLIVQGHQDPIGDKTAEDIHALIGTSTLRYIHRCGHFPWLEQPEELKTILAEFLRAN
jgi:proline iminopeptidase